MTNDFELVIRKTQAIEAIMASRLGAKGRGLHEMITSIEHLLERDLTKRLRWIATIRNRKVHDHGFELEDPMDFQQACEQAVDRLLDVSIQRSAASRSHSALGGVPAHERASRRAARVSSVDKRFWRHVHIDLTVLLIIGAWLLFFAAMIDRTAASSAQPSGPSVPSVSKPAK